MTKKHIAILGIALGVVLLVFLSTGVFLRQGLRDVGVIENIDGIPYPHIDGAIQVTEKLAHADIYLNEPVAFKNLVLSVTFDPRDLDQLAVGVRENSFWLSYPLMTLYDGGDAATGRQTFQAVIPLTDKLQEPNGSIDLMFFATHPDSSDEVDEGVSDPVHWALYGVQAHVQPTMPTYVQLKDYIRAVVKREKAL